MGGARSGGELAWAAWLRISMGDYAGAQLYIEQVLAILREALGVGHPNTILVQLNLVSLFLEMQDQASAGRFWGEAVAAGKDLLEGHPSKSLVTDFLSQAN
jgi:hypothetical protein